MLFISIQKAHAIDVKSYLITEEKELYGDPQFNTVYFTKSMSIPYKSGRVVLSANPDGTGNANIGQIINIIPTYPSSGNNFLIDVGCSTTRSLKPVDITHLMWTGHYEAPSNILIQFRKGSCGDFKIVDGVAKDYAKIGPLYVVHFDDYVSAPTPFLDLPWDYQADGKKFEDVASTMFSLFDHEYPLLSVGYTLNEPLSAQSTTISYKNTRSQEKPYSSHDGYDYALNSNVKLNDPVLASASGQATYINSCGPCGNVIHIDHGNRYQTRYYHLQHEGLITTIPGTPVQVQERQQIGKVGLTGNTDGAHIHFMVVHDKNGDGNFEDNIPDGLVDPYGWQSYDSDPWEQYTFTQNGQEKKGSKSFYLWKTFLKGINTTINSNASNFNISGYQINFPKNFTQKSLILSIKPAPISESSATLDHLGTGIKMTLWDGIDTFYTLFQNAFTLKYNFSGIDTSRYKTDTISLYSSSDNINWEKESTTIDWTKLEATTQVNHLTTFGLFGEKLDSIAPVTTAILSGTEVSPHEINKFSSPVTITLQSTDEPVTESLGIQYTQYKINDGEWKIYETSFKIDTSGTYIITYSSLDKDGNQEEFKTTEFEIIQSQIPEYDIHYDFDTNNFLIDVHNGSDEISSQIIKKRKKEFTEYAVVNHDYKTLLTTYSKNENRTFGLKFISLQYNGNEPFLLSKYRYTVTYIENKKGKKSIHQILKKGIEEKVKIIYDEGTNTSTITIKEDGEVKSKTQFSGLKTIHISTTEGNLEYTIY